MSTPMVVVEPRPDRIKPPKPPAVRKPRRLLRAFAWIFLFAVVWCAWAAFALYDLSRALDREDAVALARRVDWVAVRDGLRDDLRAASETPGASRSIDAMVGARSVVHLIRDARLTGAGWEVAAPGGAATRKSRGFQWLRVRYAFFSGGPFAIRVDIRPDSDSVRQPLVLLMRWSGDWRLERVFLPSDSRYGTIHAPQPEQRQAAAATPSARPATSSAPEPAASATAPKAVLYEEDATNPDGKSYNGTVTWRTAQAPAAAGQPPETEVRAEIEVPDKPMKLTLAIRRNTDRTLPASHILEVRIELPPDSSTGGIEDVPGIMMKTNEDDRSVALAGVSVKVRPDFYMIGLSSSDDNVRLNSEMLRQRAWFDVPIRYGNTKRAILAFQKGEAGAKAVDAALSIWGAAAANTGKN